MNHRVVKSLMLSAVLGSVCACSVSAEVPPKHIVLTDMSGENVAVWPADPSSFQGVTNHATGYPADGSELAKNIMPGFVFRIDSDVAVIVQLDEFGEPLNQDDASSLVAHIGVIDNNDQAHARGEGLPTTFVATSGVVKNPGPDDIVVQVMDGPNVYNVSIAAGDGIAINDDVFATVIPPKHEKQCLCYCVANGEPIPTEFNFRSDCPGCPEEDVLDPTNDNCCCETLHGQSCGDPNDGILEELLDCSAHWLPQETPGGA